MAKSGGWPMSLHVWQNYVSIVLYEAKLDTDAKALKPSLSICKTSGLQPKLLTELDNRSVELGDDLPLEVVPPHDAAVVQKHVDERGVRALLDDRRARLAKILESLAPVVGEQLASLALVDQVPPVADDRVAAELAAVLVDPTLDERTTVDLPKDVPVLMSLIGKHFRRSIPEQPIHERDVRFLTSPTDDAARLEVDFGCRQIGDVLLRHAAVEHKQ